MARSGGIVLASGLCPSNAVAPPTVTIAEPRCSSG